MTAETHTIEFRDDADCPPEIFKQIEGMELDLVNSKSYVNKYVSNEFKFMHEGEACRGIIIGYVTPMSLWGDGLYTKSPVMDKSYFDEYPRDRDPNALSFEIKYSFVSELKDAIKEEIHELQEKIEQLKSQLLELDKN